MNPLAYLAYFFIIYFKGILNFEFKGISVILLIVKKGK